MHLLFLTDRYPPGMGGGGSSAARVTAALARMGHPVHVLAFSPDLPPGNASTRLADHNLTVHRFGPFAEPGLTFLEALRLARWLHRRNRFDAVWGHALARAGFLAAWAGRQLGVPVVLAAQGADFDELFYPPGDFARLEWCLRAAARVAAVTAGLAAQLRALTGREVAVLPNAVDADRFRPGPRPADLALRYDLPPEAVVLGFSGELQADKGMTYLLDAFRQVRAGRPCRLLVVGDIHPDGRAEYARLVDQPAGLARDVVRTGHLPEPAQVARHLRLCDVLLLPSFRAGMPNSMLEAMACGVPVVASAVGGIPEVIADGRNGVLVPRTHLHLLGRRVLEFLGWPAERRRALAAAGRAAVLAGHTLGQERERLASLVEGLVPPAGGVAGADAGNPG